MKNKLMIAWRILVAMGMLAVIIFFTIFLIMAKDEILEGKGLKAKRVEKSIFGDYVVESYRGGQIRIRDSKDGKYLTPKLDFTFDNDGKDSLTVFRVDGQRGYLNIYTGKIAIDAQFDRAWFFSEGLGGVVKDGKLGFVNRSGDLVIPYTYSYKSGWRNSVDFLFKGGCCTVIGDNQKHGLIDKSGKWVIEPQYDYINNPENGYRIIKHENKYGLMDSVFNFTLPIEYDWLYLDSKGIVIVRDGVQSLIAYDGKTILEPFMIDFTEQLYYNSDEVNDEGDDIYKLTSCCKYTVFNKVGLMDIHTGLPITEAIYRDIKVLSKNLFRCEITSDGDEIIINNKGEVVSL